MFETVNGVDAPDHRLLGKLFGFPPCCIEFYSQRAGTTFFRQRHPGLRAMGGLRLCPACSRLPDEAIIDGIQSRRIAPTPFPTEPGPQHLGAILEHSTWTEAERDLLPTQRRFVAPHLSEEEVAALEFSTAIAEVEAVYVAEVARTPSRQPYLYAQRELAKDALLVKLMDKLHAFMRQRIAEQVKSGALTL